MFHRLIRGVSAGVLVLSMLALTFTITVSKEQSLYTTNTVTNGVPTVTPASAKYSFTDTFNYSNMSKMVAAGWIECGGGGTPDQYSVGGGLLTLYNNGVTGGAVCWTDVHHGVSKWALTTRVEWVGNYVGSLGLSFKTTNHNYLWQADGYYQRFELQVDGRFNPPTLQVPGYTPQLNTWHSLGAQMNHGLLSPFYDGNLILIFNEPGNQHDLTLFGVYSQWNTNDSYNYIAALSL